MLRKSKRHLQQYGKHARQRTWCNEVIVRKTVGQRISKRIRTLNDKEKGSYRLEVEFVVRKTNVIPSSLGQSYRIGSLV